VYAKMDTGGGATGITAFLVPADTPGFHKSEPIEKLGLNTCGFCELEFRECRVPRANIVGKPGAGFFILEHVMNYEILCIFMMMAGEMQERMERCIKWAKTRRAFDRPIGSNQYVAGKIVDMKIGLENSRKHLYDTAARFAKGRSVTIEISMAKLVTSEANVASALNAIQIFGARGYTREYGLEKGLRDAIGAPIYSGTNETQRVRIASMLGL
jgi:alkylation response protein AidB-like acyl-CoA dehydrogenase